MHCIYVTLVAPTNDTGTGGGIASDARAPELPPNTTVITRRNERRIDWLVRMGDSRTNDTFPRYRDADTNTCYRA